jgi:hypothetical protein
MATIKVQGESTNEATITTNDEGQARFECSRGMWCDRQDDMRWEDSMDDAIEHAEMHVDLHDEADLAKINGPR